jgi:parvulin-like peptidyl-prolyl isomerase
MAIRRLTLLWGAVALAGAPVVSAAPEITKAHSLTRVATKPASVTSSSTSHAVAHPQGPVAALVNGEPITEAEWLTRLRLMAGKNALDSLVQDKILHQEARKNGIVVSPAEVDAKAAENEKNTRARFGQPAQFENALKQRGWSVASYRDYLRHVAELQLLQEKLTKKLGEKVQVTDKEVQDLYEKSKFQFMQPAEVKIAQIMINFAGLDDASQNKTKADAAAILEKAKAPGADFTVLAKQYSQDTASKDKGGELPWMSFSSYGQLFDQVVMAAPVGLVDQPVRSYKGYHIVKVLDKHPQRTRPFDEVKADLRKRLLDQRQAQQYRDYMQKAESAAKTEVKLRF